MSNNEKNLEYATKKVTELSLYICKIQDDIASLVSTHRSDWSWKDVVEDVKKLVEERDNLKKQTAAKDAEITELRQQLDIWEANEPCPECGEAHECGVQAQLRDLRHKFGCEQQAREAAERKRDSLRAQLKYL